MTQSLDHDAIVKAAAADCDIYLLQQVDSTNDWVRRKLGAQASLPLACFAETQTRGRGRRGKQWLSPPGAGITMSLAWHFELAASEIGALSLAMGVAVARCLQQAGIEQVALKWPNDVLVGGRKIAGILIETAAISDTAVTAVVGIGLNYYLPATTEPGQPWTDVCRELGATDRPGRSLLAASLLQQCLRVCRDFVPMRDSLLAEFARYDACDKRMVRVLLDSGEQLEGIAHGVTASGELRVRIENQERVFNSAQITLRTGLAGGDVTANDDRELA